MPDLNTGEWQVLERAVDLHAQRHHLIVSNLANAETPGYRAVKLPFENLLQEMVDRRAQPPLRTTQPGHLPGAGPGGGAPPQVVVRTEGAGRDGNTVNSDQELVDLSVNQVQYNAKVEALTRMFKLLDYAIDEGGK